MLNLSQILKEKLEDLEKGKRTIVFFPGSFRPPTKYHLEAVKEYSDLADEVYIVISKPSLENKRFTSKGFAISQDTAKLIFDEYIHWLNLPNVKVLKAVDSPLSYVFQYIRNSGIKDAQILLGTSDKENDRDRFVSFQKIMNDIEKSIPGITFLDPKKYLTHKPTSNKNGSSDAREHIDDYEYLKKNYIPEKMPEDLKKKIFRLFNRDEKSTKILNEIYKSFLSEAEEIPNTPKKNLKKIGRIPVAEFKESFSNLAKALTQNGVIRLHATPKTDGQAIRLAWTKDDIFVESAHSGAISDPNEMNIPQFKKILQHFKAKNMFNKIHDFINSEDFKDGIKIVGELLFNQRKMRDSKGKTITFVGTKYDSEKLGGLATIVIFDILQINGEKTEQLEIRKKNKILRFIYNNISNSIVSFIFNGSFSGTIKISLLDFSEPSVKTLKEFDSLSPKSDSEKLLSLQSELEYILTKKVERSRKPKIVSPEGKLEGLIFEVGGKKYVAQNPEWNDLRKNYSKYIDHFNAVINNFLKDITGHVQKATVLKAIDNDNGEIREKYREKLNPFLKDLEKAKDIFFKHKKEMPAFIYFNSKFFMLEKYNAFAGLTKDLDELRERLSKLGRKEPSNAMIPQNLIKEAWRLAKFKK